jgi:CheY-like chemotaxis protein
VVGARRALETLGMTDLPEAPGQPLRILVVDPDDRIRESLARLLPIGGRCLVVGSAGDPETALTVAASLAFDVVMLDARLADTPAGPGLVARLRAARPGIRVVVLNWAESGDSAARLDGADAYIRKTFRPHELIDAVISAARTTAA